jgi:periplasmic divalent cation tolerance protein
MSCCIIFCTVPTESLANEIATGLIEQSLAACVKIVPDVTAVYRWDEKVVTDKECQLLIKTVQDNVEPAFKFVCSHHPYEVPEWLVLPDVQGSDDYVRWIHSQTK